VHAVAGVRTHSLRPCPSVCESAALRDSCRAVPRDLRPAWPSRRRIGRGAGVAGVHFRYLARLVVVHEVVAVEHARDSSKNSSLEFSRHWRGRSMRCRLCRISEHFPVRLMEIVEPSCGATAGSLVAILNLKAYSSRSSFAIVRPILRKLR